MRWGSGLLYPRYAAGTEMLKHLPPTAVPIQLSDLKRGLNPPDHAVGQFSLALAGYLGSRACYLAASGRTALYLLLKSLSEATDHPARREVLIPAYTCPVLVKVVLDLDLSPRLVDISPHTLAFESEQVEARLSHRTLAVICVHPFGIPQPVEPLLALAEAVGAVVIEDAAQSLGARWGGQPVGSHTHFGLFSLGPGKPLSTGGGGILCANRQEHAQLIQHAWETLPQPSAALSAWTLVHLGLSALVFHPAGWWLAVRVGLNRLGEHRASWGYRLRRLSAAQAGIGLALLERLDAINRQRMHNARQLITRLASLDRVYIPPPAPAAEPIYLRLPLLVPDQDQRERLVERLGAAGIGAGRMYRHPLPDLFPQLASENYPGASYVARHLLTLPTHHYLTASHVEKIAHIFQAEMNE